MAVVRPKLQPWAQSQRGVHWLLAALGARQCEDSARDKLEFPTDHADSARAGRRGLTVVDHPGGTGVADTAAEADQPRLPRRLAAGSDRADRGLRRVLRPPR